MISWNIKLLAFLKIPGFNIASIQSPFTKIVKGDCWLRHVCLSDLAGEAWDSPKSSIPYRSIGPTAVLTTEPSDHLLNCTKGNRSIVTTDHQGVLSPPGLKLLGRTVVFMGPLRRRAGRQNPYVGPWFIFMCLRSYKHPNLSANTLLLFRWRGKFSHYLTPLLTLLQRELLKTACQSDVGPE